MRAKHQEAGAALIAVALAMFLVAVMAMPLGMAMLLRGQRAASDQGTQRALLLAESGAAQAIVHLEGGLLLEPGATAPPVLVCTSGTSLTGAACSPASADYAGCYTYGPSRFSLAGLTACPARSRPSFAFVAGREVMTVYGAGIARDGTPHQIRARYDTASGSLLSWEVLP
jgi:hypothetical protein